MTSTNKTVSPPKVSEGAAVQNLMTSEGNSALLPANVDRRPPLLLSLQRVSPIKTPCILSSVAYISKTDQVIPIFFISER